VPLTIEPGVTAKFDSGKVMEVEGTLMARGTSTGRATFTSSAASPAAGDWRYINETEWAGWDSNPGHSD